ncbi:MAG: ATP-binding protein [Candidatus Gracilibacteria bacterium]|nr:ATP-binding protein [Candidatus Gracilibacteria bacterium]
MSCFIIVRGPLGCGKSTIAVALAHKIHGHVFSIDDILEKHGLVHEKEAGYISQQSFFRANEIAARTAEKTLKNRTPIIFDGNFYWRSQIENLEQQLPFPLFIFTLNAPLKTCIERDKNRKKTHGEMATKVVYQKSTEFDAGILIDATQPVEKCIEEMLLHLPPFQN